MMDAPARRPLPDPADLADQVRRRDRAAIAAALNLLDDRRDEARGRAIVLAGLLSEHALPDSHLVGITGPPGSGKSSLTSALIRAWRREGRTVGVLAVDPSSPRTGGALLGDRIRMLQPVPDDGVFIRSLASRGELGGLSPEVWPMSIILLAAFDLVLVETVGIGQSEIDVSQLADTTLYVVQPASGDTIQFLKSGIMEVPDVFAVNKADLGPLADRTARELAAALPRREETQWRVPVRRVSAASGRGIDELRADLEQHRTWLANQGELVQNRRRHQARWIVKRLREEFGHFGIEWLGGARKLLEELTDAHGSPLAAHRLLRDQLREAFSNRAV